VTTKQSTTFHWRPHLLRHDHRSNYTTYSTEEKGYSSAAMMDMDMPAGIPWLGQPVVLHEEGGRVFTCKFNDTALCNWQSGYWRFW
jgi:hypothetical protein